MATEKTLKARLKMKHGKASEWALATRFTPLEGEIIVYDVDETYTSPRFKVGDGLTNVNNLKFVNQDELAKITTLGDELLAVKNGYLPLAGGTISGALAVQAELYCKQAVISERDSCPQFIMKNTNGAQLGTIYSTSTDGNYADVEIAVNSSSSDIAHFTFAKDGQFTAPNDINTEGGLYAKGGIFSTTNSYPGIMLRNADYKQLAQFYSTSSDGSYGNVLLRVSLSDTKASYFTFKNDGIFAAPSDIISNGGILKSSKDSRPLLALTNASSNWLTSLAVETTDGSYGHAQLTVYKSATESNTFTFGNTGNFRAPNTVYSSLFAVQSNNFPQLTLQNNKAANLATLYVNTTTGDYSSVYLRVYSSASAYSTFNFGNDGKLSCGSLALATALPISSGGTGSTTASNALSNLGGLAEAGGTMSGGLSIKNGTRVSQITFAPSFDTSYGGAIVYDAGGTNIYGGSTNFYIRQYSITNGATSSEGMGKFEQFNFPSTASGLTASASYAIFTTKNPPTATQVGALPLTGGTLTGALTAKELYASDGNVTGLHLVTKTDNYPEVYFKNATGATLADLWVDTTTGSYAPVILRVHADASTSKDFTFGKDGTFSIPNSFSTVMGEFKSNAWPQMFFRNANGNSLAQLIIPTDNGSYSGLAVNVFSDASNHVEYKFNSDGTFKAPFAVQAAKTYVRTNNYPEHIFQNANGVTLAELYANTTTGAYAPIILRVKQSVDDFSEFTFGRDGSFIAPSGITTTGNYISIKNNSYPQFIFTNASGADIGKFFVSTTNGSYAATKIRAYSSASSYYDFQFLGTGSFSCKTINADGIDIGADSLVQLSQNDNKGSGCISIGNINLGDWRVISVADDGRLLIDYTNPIYALGSSVIYSSSQPSSPTTGMIWLKPV